MSKNKSFTGPLARYMQEFLNEKRALGFKYVEQERLLLVLDRMSLQHDCSKGLSRDLCLAFTERDPNWRRVSYLVDKIISNHPYYMLK